jgi:hypothetical protein
MSQEQAKLKLPETPFNGVVLSAVWTKTEHWSYLHLAIADEDACAESPVIVFASISGGSDTDPRMHLQKGDKVKVVSVCFQRAHIMAYVHFDAAQLMNRLGKTGE